MGMMTGHIPDPLQTKRIEPPPDMSGRAFGETGPAPGAGFRDDERQIHAGFGDNTISIPALVAHTVDRNFEEARKMLPSLEELRAAQQARAEERRAEAQERLEAQRATLGASSAQEPVIRVDFQRAESQARAQTQAAASAPNSSAAPAGIGTPAFAKGPDTSVRAACRAFVFAPLALARFDVRG
ncbi:MAG TPA: hypothetical protein PLD73_17420 [Candidatus Hydrogenedentes bacterium]|jgi:type II secretory pathway component HofQ|nr:hypothetical protein [Candidatus Hydrogenedentota bacterium]